MGDTRRSQFGKMFTELLARHRAKTSEQSSKPSGKSVKETIAFLDMRKTDLDGKNGRSEGSSWEIIPLSLGEDLTLNFGESPKDASVCSLFSILEDNVPDRYFLSVTACKGILRRSEISIHAPLAGCDRRRSVPALRFGHISIHAPLAGCDKY